MTLLGRIGSIATGLGGTLQAPVGLVMDLAKASYADIQEAPIIDKALPDWVNQHDPDYQGFVHVLWGRTINRGSQMLGDLFGPEDSVVGSSIGAVPKAVRNPVGDVIHPILNGSEWLYHNAVSHPLATILTVGALTNSAQFRHEQGVGEWGALFDPDAWSQAWDISQHRSPGQAMAIDLAQLVHAGPDDILDPGEMAKFEGTDFYHVTSGITDFVTRYDFDPLALAGEFVQGARLANEGQLTAGVEAKAAALKAGATPEEAAAAGFKAHTQQVSEYLSSNRWEKLNDAIAKIKGESPDLHTAIGTIQQRLFPDHALGDKMAAALGQAATDNQREFTMRVLMGDNTAIQLLDDAPALREHLRMDFENEAGIKTPQFTEEYHHSPSYRPDANPASLVDDNIQGLEAADRLRDVAARIDHEMKAPGAVANKLTGIKTSEFYQQSAWTKPVRVFFNEVPSGYINLDDPNAVHNMDGMLRQAGLLEEERAPWIGKFATAAPEERVQVVLDAEKAALKKLAEKHGVSPEDLDVIRQGAGEYRRVSAKMLQEAEKDAKGRSILTLPGMDEADQVAIRASETGNEVFVANMRKIDKQFGFWSRNGLDGVTAVPREIINDAMKVWRPFTLLRPAWPMRIVGDHSLVMLGKLDQLSGGVDALRKTMTEYGTFRHAAHNYYAEVSKELGLGWGGGTGALFGGIVAGPLGALAGGGIGTAAQVFGRSLEEVPYHQFMVNGWTNHGAFGNELDKQELWHSLVSSRRDLDAGIGRGAPGKLNLLATDPEAAITLMPGKPGYTKGWEAAVNDSIGRDPMARIILQHDHLPNVETTGAEAALNWLKSPEGRTYAAQHPVLAADPEQWVNTMRTQVHELTANDPELAAKVAKGTKVTIQDLEKAVAPKGIDEHLTNEMRRLFPDTPIGEYQDAHNGYLNQIPVSSQHFERNVGLVPEGSGTYQDIPVDKIVTSQREIYPSILKNYIKEMRNGVAQEPIQVEKVGDHYVLYEGAHRSTAAKLLGHQTIQADVIPTDAVNEAEAAARISQTIEPAQRAVVDLSEERSRLPTVHREYVDQVVGRSKVLKRINNTVENLFKALGSMPLDNMINDRYFSWIYRKEMERTLTGLEHGYRQLTADEIREEVSRIFPKGPKDVVDVRANNVLHQVPDDVFHILMRQDAPPAFTKGVDQRIPIDKIVTTQGDLAISDVKGILANNPQSLIDEPVMVEKVGDYYWLQDGNHRTTSAKLRGDKDIIATVFPERVADPEGVSKAIRERMTPGRDVRMRVPETGPSEETIRAMEDSARKVALNEMRRTMYDYANRSEFAEMVRNVMPFFPAWQQTIQRWAGIAYENPAFIRRAQMVLDIPGKMGATWTDKDTGESYIRFRIPDFARQLVGHGVLGSALDDQGYYKFQLHGITPALGAPGFGPWVDVALQPFVRAKPELADSLKLIYPYGIPDNALQAFMPPNVEHVLSTAEQDGRSYRSSYNRILITRLVKMQTGESPILDFSNADIRGKFLKDVNSEAHQFSAFKTISAMFSPISGMQYDSPYQPLIDIYREMVNKDPNHAADKFLDEYGDDFFALTQSFSKLNNGIPPTLEGEKDFEKYRDMVERFPELGSLITGQEGGGSAVQFSSAAYTKQLHTPVRPGSSIMQRTQLSPEQIIANDDARLGWIKFTRAMDLIDAEASQRGLPNLNVKDATDLRLVKDEMIAGIAKDHPDWYNDYNQRDENKWTNRIAAMETIVKDDRLSQRPDIEALSGYLDMRRAIVAELAGREHKTLQAQDNIDIRSIWDSYIQRAKNGPGGLAFSDLWNRWLVNDPVAPLGVNTIGADIQAA